MSEIINTNDYINYLTNKYGVVDFYYCNTNKIPEVELLEKTIYNDSNIWAVLNENRPCFIFPEYDIGIFSSENFINSIPVLKELLSGNWNDKYKTYKLWNEKYNTVVNSGKVFEINSLPLESLLYDKPFSYQIRDHNDMYSGRYKVTTNENESLYDSIMSVQNEKYIKRNFPFIN